MFENLVCRALSVGPYVFLWLRSSETNTYSGFHFFVVMLIILKGFLAFCNLIST